MNKMIKEILPNIRVANEVRIREGGDNGLFITLVPKFYNNVFYSLALQHWGLLVD